MKTGQSDGSYISVHFPVVQTHPGRLISSTFPPWRSKTRTIWSNLLIISVQNIQCLVFILRKTAKPTTQILQKVDLNFILQSIPSRANYEVSCRKSRLLLSYHVYVTDNFHEWQYQNVYIYYISSQFISVLKQKNRQIERQDATKFLQSRIIKINVQGLVRMKGGYPVVTMWFPRVFCQQ